MSKTQLLKALYSFKKTHESSISFEAGDLLLELEEKMKDKHWIYALHISGGLGFIPKNYVAPISDKQRSNTALVAFEKNILSLDFIPHKELVLKHLSELKASEPKKKRLAPQPPEEAKMAREIVDIVRSGSGLPYGVAKEVSMSVLSYVLQHKDPNIKALLSSLDSLGTNSSELLPNYESPDAKAMEVLLQRLTECKEDDQQRNWMLHEDESTIGRLLESLYDLLVKVEPRISVSVLSRFKYFYVQSLIEYFQMETRWPLRRCLMEIFLTMCSLDGVIISLALNSVLPLELAQDMFTNLRDLQRVKHASLLLTVVFSRGEALPVQYFSQLGEGFVEFILKQIEDPQSFEHEREMSDIFVGLLLSYNLQFTRSSHKNVLMEVLSRQRVAKVYTESILLLLNREEDPAAIVLDKDSPPVVHSTRKVILDMFHSSSKCHNLFYTNDIYVLIDIIVRQLTDLNAEDPRRRDYLEMCDLVLRHTSYSDHLHRFKDLENCFIRILNEEDDEDTSSKEDKRVVLSIAENIQAFNNLA